MRIAHYSTLPIENDARIARAVSAAEKIATTTMVIAPENGLAPASFGLNEKLKLGASFFLASISSIGRAQKFWLNAITPPGAVKRLAACDADIIQAHDWTALPAASTAAGLTGARLIYDSHEYARQLHSERLLWRSLMLPGITRLEAHYIKTADAVIAVSDGLADLMQRDHRLTRRPTVIKNVPDVEDARRKTPVPGTVVMHYHGIISPARGLEVMIGALARLPRKYRLKIVGPERKSGYCAKLKQIAAELNVSDRLIIDDAVANDMLVELASDAHFGLCLLPVENEHNRLALPNKLFEYMHAALVPVVSGSDEMRRIVDETGVGIVLQNHTADALARAVMENEHLLNNETRRRVLKASENYRWAEETKRLQALYRQLKPA